MYLYVSLHDVVLILHRYRLDALGYDVGRRLAEKHLATKTDRLRQRLDTMICDGCDIVTLIQYLNPGSISI